ncbi:MAG: hypothetical protein ABFD08_13910 [Syntrophomonas sp.]
MQGLEGIVLKGQVFKHNQLNKAISLALLTVLLLLNIHPQVHAVASNDNTPKQQVVIFMIDKLSIDDIDSHTTPHLWSLINKGGMGLLNTVTGGDRTTKNGCCTISAGKLAVGSSFADQNFEYPEFIDGEKAGDVFSRNTGIFPREMNLLVSSFVVIKKNNEERSLGNAGQLGDDLHQLGCTTAVIGNSDRPGYYSRPGSLVLMDSRGIVDEGAIDDKLLIADNPRALPAKTNYAQIYREFPQLKDNDVVLVEFGDLSRLESMYTMFAKKRYQIERTTILRQIDKSIGKITTELISPPTCIYVISPSPSRNSFVPSALLTPLIIVKPGFNGTITSYSTRREGVVLSTGLKNSILNCLSGNISETIYSSPNNNTYQDLKTVNQREVFSYVNQAWILSALIAPIFLLLLIALSLILKQKWLPFSRLILLFALSFPLTLLFMGALEVFNRPLFVLIFLLINLALSIFSFLLARIIKINPFIPILVSTIAVIGFDLITDKTLIENSIMSYRVISGARYYGIGNEYMGVLLGACISLVALNFDHSFGTLKRLGTAIFFATITFLIAYPRFGINVGGAITASAGLGYSYLIFKPQNNKINYTKVILLTVITLSLIAAMAIIDLRQPPEVQSHLGHSISLILNGGVGEILNIIGRKINMQARVISYGGLGWVFLLLLISSCFFIFHPSANLNRFRNRMPGIFKGLQGLLGSAIIAVLFNDSGITSAASLALYFLVLLLYALDQKYIRGTPQFSNLST